MVEYMARSGLNSKMVDYRGPKMDIVPDGNLQVYTYLPSLTNGRISCEKTADRVAEAYAKALSMPSEDVLEMRESAHELGKDFQRMYSCPVGFFEEMVRLFATGEKVSRKTNL